MKKFLPKSLNNTFGFTLIELMVVVTIIAILAVIGISLYSSAQKQARDGVRRVEVNSLGKTIETSKNPTDATYTYDSTHYDADYPQNKPADPSKNDSAPGYCIATSTATTPLMPGDPATWGSTDHCPTAPVAVTGATGYSELIKSSNSAFTPTAGIATGVKYWKVCARMEALTSKWYCVQSNSP